MKKIAIMEKTERTEINEAFSKSLLMLTLKITKRKKTDSEKVSLSSDYKSYIFISLLCVKYCYIVNIIVSVLCKKINKKFNCFAEVYSFN